MISDFKKYSQNNIYIENHKLQWLIASVKTNATKIITITDIYEIKR